jgi:hypothetical protein
MSLGLVVLQTLVWQGWVKKTFASQTAICENRICAENLPNFSVH